jgi:dihydroflavonol-4-reductase
VRALVTGAAGFIGAHVAAALAAGGAAVRAFDRDEPAGGRIEDWVRGDVLDVDALRRALGGCDAVFHLAAIYSYSRGAAARMLEVNLEGTRNVLAAAGERRVVHTSSAATCGPVPGRAATERDEPPSWELKVAYKRSKIESERLALRAGAVVVNPTTPVGPGDRRPTPTGQMIDHVISGRARAFVRTTALNVVSVDDVARGHLLAHERGRAGERYILGGVNLGWVELIDRIADLSGIHHPIAVLPPEAAALARMQAALRLPGVIAPEGVLLMAANWRASSQKARKELRYRSRPLEKTLRETVDWYLELIDRGVFAGRRVSPTSLAAGGMRAAHRLGLTRGLQAAERYAGRRLVAGA